MQAATVVGEFQSMAARNERKNMTAPDPIVWKMGCIEVLEYERNRYYNGNFIPHKYYRLLVNGARIAEAGTKPGDFKQWAKQKIRAGIKRRVNRELALQNQLTSKQQETHELRIAESIL